MLRTLVAMVLILCGGLSASAEPRSALVIGNAAYSYGPLANAVNDASDMAKALEANGFRVTLLTDADQQAMEEAIAAFGETLKEAGGVGLFYFAGHGVQVGGENYILPIGEALRKESDVKYKAVATGQVTDALAGNHLNIVILDSCRNNPLAAGGRSTTRGLARVEGGSGLFVSFATSPGSVAEDGEGRNSPYTRHLLQALATPGLSLEETFKRTLKGVHQETNGRQTPWISSSFFGDFVFRPAGPAPVAEAAGAETQAAAEVAALEPSRQVPAAGEAPRPAGIYRASGVNPDGSRYRGMVAVTPSGDAWRFTWWIGKQKFAGNGRFAGRMLVVDWGDAHPVIYTFGEDGRLDGEWADGSATETLDLFGGAEAGEAPSPGGDYRVAGRNADGSTYDGSVTISRKGASYRLGWRVGSSSYRGTGTLDGNLLTVDWGDPTPVVYALAADGTLTGLWDAGRGEEVLTPLR
jgi:uncharacterized caspase-like protein